MKKMIRKRLSLRREAIRQLAETLLHGAHGGGMDRSEPTMATDCFNTCGGPAVCAGQM